MEKSKEVKEACTIPLRVSVGLSSLFARDGGEKERGKRGEFATYVGERRKSLSSYFPYKMAYGVILSLLVVLVFPGCRSLSLADYQQCKVPMPEAFGELGTVVNTATVEKAIYGIVFAKEQPEDILAERNNYVTDALFTLDSRKYQSSGFLPDSLGKLWLNLTYYKKRGNFLVQLPHILTLGALSFLGIPTNVYSARIQAEVVVYDAHNQAMAAFSGKGKCRIVQGMYYGYWEKKRAVFVKSLSRALDEIKTQLTAEEEALMAALREDYSLLLKEREWAEVQADSDSAALAEANDAFREERYGEAVAKYDTILARFPYHLKALLARGKANLLQKEYDKADADFRKVILLSPENAEAYYLLGVNNQNYEALGTENYSKDCFTRAIQLAPEMAEAYLMRGVAYEVLGEETSAINDYKKALEIDPGMTAARENLNNFYARKEQKAYERKMQARQNLINAMFFISTTANVLTNVLNANGSVQIPTVNSSLPAASAPKRNLTQVVCPACNGSKVNPYHTGAPSFGLGGEKICEVCGKKVPDNYYHDKCIWCKGKGYIYR